MPAENQQQHHHPAKEPIESDVPDGVGGANLFDDQVEKGEQQCGGQHEQGAGSGGIQFDLSGGVGVWHRNAFSMRVGPSCV
jgi:hypothetical protein